VLDIIIPELCGLEKTVGLYPHRLPISTILRAKFITFQVFSVPLRKKKEKRNRHLLDFNSSPAGELETTKMPSYYMDEDYPVRPEI